MPARTDPVVSVVVPAHQAAPEIGACLTSVLWQSYPALELIVVDDGSIDDTAALVAAHTDARVRLVRQERAGAAAARNRGLHEAQGDLVAFLDADDVLLPDHLSAAVAVWRRTGGIVTSNAYWMYPGGIDPRLTRHRGSLPAPHRQRLTLLQHNWVSIMSLFPRQLPDEIGYLDPSLERAEDWDFWLRAVFAGWQVHHQPRPLALFNRSITTQSSAHALVHSCERRVLEQMAARADLRDAERAYLRLRLAGPAPGELVSRAEDDLLARRYRQAAKRLRQAATLAPADRVLALKSRLLAVAPAVSGPALRRRARARGARLGAPDGSRPDGT